MCVSGKLLFAGPGCPAAGTQQSVVKPTTRFLAFPRQMFWKLPGSLPACASLLHFSVAHNVYRLGEACMELCFPEAGYVGFLSFFSCATLSVSVNVAPTQNIQGKCIKMQGQCRVVFSCTFKKINCVPTPFRVKTRSWCRSVAKALFILLALTTESRGKRKLGGLGRGKSCKRKSFLPVPQAMHLLGSLPLQSRQVWWHKWHCPLNSNFLLGHCITQRPSSKTLLWQREA